MDDDFGYITVQHVQMLRHAAKPHGIRVTWLANGQVRLKAPDGQVIYCSFSRHVQPVLDALRNGSLP